jgi:hypothetical protein
MNKIPTLFERDWDGDRSRVLDRVVAGCEWVLEGEGEATRKYDGTCVMFDGVAWWSRREVKDGKKPPPGFVSSGHDHITLKNIGWEPIEQSPFAKFQLEALEEYGDSELAPGTYELCGPKVQGNPERLGRHELIEHAAQVLSIPSRSFKHLRAYLDRAGIEGIVFHHPDGRRMAKIKTRDFGLAR